MLLKIFALKMIWMIESEISGENQLFFLVFKPIFAKF